MRVGDQRLGFSGPFLPTGMADFWMRVPHGRGDAANRDPSWYETTSGVVTVPLEPAHALQAAATPIALVVGGSVVLGEALDGVWLRADENVFRFDPGDTLSTTIHVTRFGAPFAHQRCHSRSTLRRLKAKVRPSPPRTLSPFRPQ